MNEYGEFIKKDSIITPKYSIEIFIETINTIVKDFQNNYFLSGIALSMPGAVDVKEGCIGGGSAIPYIHGPNIKKLLQDKTKLRVELENDGNCAGLAEGWIGAAKDVKDYVCIVLGSGVGGAIVLDRKIHHGKNLHGGEFGDMIMENYLDQQIGENWNSLAATAGLVSQVAKRKRKAEWTLDGKKVFEMEDNGDEKVKDEIEKFLKRLAVGIFNIQYVIDPEKILIGGAISERHDLIERINEKLKLMKKG
ncbi:ROK family protein [Neobacillus sp. PS3-40]|uniref:ROK family protein n=1 Tax=Neobacillus sp. PS3-40 TaxID=3070679 RepID=UPI0027E04337|nr:ROK family protein [Neobacillus sp. PS3-40]WML45806.1 ROK family protein [Neobacillus sp. PS3-40]